MLAPYCTPGLIPYIKEWTDKRTLAIYSSTSFATMQLPAFNIYHSLFYKTVLDPETSKISYIKIVPTNIQDLLSPEGLAYWIMGDGSRQNDGMHLSIYAFTNAECTLLLNALTNKWSLNCTIHSTKSGPRIYVDGKSMNIVRELTKDHMDPLMYYKIGL